MLAWLRQRYPLPQQLQLMQDRLVAPDAPSIAVLVRDHGDPGALARTLGSLDDLLYQRIQVCVLGAVEPRRPNVQWLPADARAPLAAINGLLESSPCDWCMLVDAGVEFTASGLLVAALDLAQAPVTFGAVFADEAVRGADDSVEARLRPDLNLTCCWRTRPHCRGTGCTTCARSCSRVGSTRLQGGASNWPTSCD